MNRIYQGRVNKVEVPDGKDAEGKPKWKEMKDWQTVLWRHHEIFQDAVNYYTLALAAMAEGLKPDTVEGKAVLEWRDRVKESWVEAKRKAVKFDGPHQRIVKLLGLNPSQSDFNSCATKVLEKCNANKKVRAEALLRLLELADDASDLSVFAVDKLPWLCDPDTKKKTDDIGKSAKRKKAQEFVRKLHSSVPKDIPQISHDFSPSLFVQTVKRIKGEEAKSCLKKYFAEAAKGDSQISYLSKEFDEAVIKKLALNREIEVASKRYQSIFPLAVLFKHWSVQEVVVDAFKRATERLANGKDVLAQSSDPLRVLRTDDDLPAIEYFSNIEFVKDNGSKNRAVWFEFDLAAFVEAIKSPHRYFQDTIKRDAEAQKIREKLQAVDPAGKWIDDSRTTSKSKKKMKSGDSTDDDDGDTIDFTFKDDERIKLIRQLVSDEKEGLAYLVEAEVPEMETEKAEYTIQERTLRGWSKVRDGLRKVSGSKEWPKLSQVEQKEKLWAVVVAEQGGHRDDFGSSALYKMLTQPKYHAIWRDNGSQGDHADDPLRAWMKFTELRMELKDKERPIRFTPAHAVHSPRYFIFPKKYQPKKSVKSKKRQAVTKGLSSEHEKGALAFIVGTIVEQNGKCQPIKVRISYSAPRLRRDELRNDDETDLTQAKWMQPMMKAMGLPEVDPTDFSSCRITLQPESLRNIQLTFPVEVAVDKLKAGVGKESLWNRQFNLHPEGNSFYNATLRWPHEKQPKNPPSPWCKNVNTFTCLSVDLGQRDAGAYALLESRANHDFGKKPSRFIGETLDKKWRAVLRASGLLRLSGE